MLRGYRIIIVAVGLVSIPLSAIGFYYTDNAVTKNAGTKENNTPSSSVSSPRERIAGALEAIERGQNSKEASEQARRDLDAQEGTWRWAKVSAWTAFIQMIISTIGIIFVVDSLRQGRSGLAAARRALRHARRANEIAQDAAYQQLRPYIYVEKIEPRAFVSDTKEIIVVIRNYGQTPANIVNFSLGCNLFEKTAEQWPVPQFSTAPAMHIPPTAIQRIGVAILDKWKQPIIDGTHELRIVVMITFQGFGVGLSATSQSEEFITRIHFSADGPVTTIPETNAGKLTTQYE